MANNFDDVYRWVQLFDTLENRVAIINQLHGCRYDFSKTNPCLLEHGRGWYLVKYDGNEIARFRVYDLDSITSAFGIVDGFANAIWLLRRAGRFVKDL